jgi:hypothetical protein
MVLAAIAVLCFVGFAQKPAATGTVTGHVTCAGPPDRDSLPLFQEYTLPIHPLRDSGLRTGSRRSDHSEGSYILGSGAGVGRACGLRGGERLAQ